MRYEKSALRAVVEERFDEKLAIATADYEAARDWNGDVEAAKYREAALDWLNDQRHAVMAGAEIDTYTSPDKPRQPYRTVRNFEAKVEEILAAKAKALQRVDALMPDADGGVTLTLPQLDRLTLNGA